MQLADQLQEILRSLSFFGPELFLVAGIAGLVLADLVLLHKSPSLHRPIMLVLSMGLLLILGVLVVQQSGAKTGFLFGSMLFLDEQAVFFKLLVMLGGGVAVLHAWLTRPSLPLDWLSILFTLLLGLFLMTMSVNLLMIYLSIEVVSISSYLLTALSGTRKTAEGGIKYLLFGAVSAAIMLYGISLIYGLTGTMDLTSSLMGAELAKNSPYVVYLASLLVLVGVFFKLSLVPFHIWTPDVYEAAPTPVVSFFSVAPKAAALLVLMRILTSLPASFQTPLAVVALTSITLGNLSALWQTDARRLLAYSTIAHAGFLLVGISAFSEAGFQAATFYAATYLFINMAAFLLLDLLADRQNGQLSLKSLEGLGFRHPQLALALTVVMVALTGLPPTVGFTAKLLAFSALWETIQQSGDPWQLALFAIGLFNILLSLFYYLKIPYLLYFRSAPDVQDTLKPTGGGWLVLVLTVPILLFFFRPDWLMRWITEF